MYTIPNTLQTALTNKTPQRVLLEFIKKPSGAAYNPVVTYSNEHILVNTGVELDETFQSEEDFGVGGTPSAEIRFEMVNDEGQLRTFEFGTFRAWLGARIDSGTPASGTKTATFTEGGVNRTYQFTPLGTFIAHRPNIVSTKTIAVDANDQMTLFDVEMPKDSASGFNVTWPTTLGNLLTKMCNYLGVTQVSTSFTNSTLTVSGRPKAFDNATMRDVLGWIAEAAGSVARFDRDGKLKMAWFNTVSKTYTESSYSDFTPYRYETKAVNRLSVRKDGNESTTGSGKNAVMILNNPFIGKNTSAAESNVYNRLTAAPTFHPASASLFTDWNIEAGDVVTVQNEGTNYTMPMYNVRLKWSGDTKVDAESTGNEQRESLPALEKKYYGGAGGLYTAKNGDIWYNEVLDEVNSIRSVVMQTESTIRAWVEDADSHIASLDINVNSIRAEVANARSEYAAFVIEASQIRGRVETAEGNASTALQTATGLVTTVSNIRGDVSTLQQTASTLVSTVSNARGDISILQQSANTFRADIAAANSQITELMLSMSGISLSVINGKTTTYRQWNNPGSAAGGSHTLYVGDRWIKTKDVGKWSDLGSTTWGGLDGMTWGNAAGPIEYVWTGSAWVVVGDYGSDILVGAQLNVLDDRIQGIVRDVNGNSSMIEQTASYVRSVVSDARTGLSSLIEQTASQIRSEVSTADNSMRSEILQNASQIALKVTKGNVATQLAVECGNVSVTGGNLNVDGYVTAAAFSGLKADLTGTGTAMHLYSTYLDVTKTLSVGSAITANGTSGLVSATSGFFAHGIEISTNYGVKIGTKTAEWKSKEYVKSVTSSKSTSRMWAYWNGTAYAHQNAQSQFVTNVEVTTDTLYYLGRT